VKKFGGSATARLLSFFFFLPKGFLGKTKKKVKMVASSSSATAGFAFAVLAGATAAMASVFGKLSMDASHITAFVLSVDPEQNENAMLVVRALQAACFGMIILCNIGMWSLFVRALDRLPSSLVATAVNTAVNFFTSAFLGFVLFGEQLPIMWWAGASLIIVGLQLMNTSKVEEDKEKTQ
jgi:drug/metabolite transporter (DMT)-like permease